MPGCCSGISHGHSHGNSARTPAEMTIAEKTLTAILKPTGLLKLAEALHDSMAVIGLSWGLLAFAGVASITRWAPPAYINTAIAVVYLTLGLPALVDVMYELARGAVNMHVLTTAAVFGTVYLGCAIEGCLLLALLATAHLVEERLTATAQGNLKALWDSVPSTANLVSLFAEDGSPDLSRCQNVAAAEVEVGSYTLVRAGEQVPLDGEVIYGAALVSTQHITGEALPIPKRIGDEIPAGSQVTDSVLVIKTTRSSEDSTPMRIARLTAEAQKSRPEVSSFLNKFSDQYSRVVLGLTAVSFAVLVGVGQLPINGPGGALYRALAFLSAAAPCALLMTPLAYVAGIAACAQRGILVRDGLTLEKIASCNTIALDKTGTITTGIMKCVAIEPMDKTPGKQYPPQEDTEALAVATAMERLAVHPIADAIVECGVANDVPNVRIEEFKTYPGKGVEGLATVKGMRPTRVRL
eukprot:CAMPEP_0198215018 /NCGR_PEP_ID=MMETSP1445-20131203/46320_1 /TAXON_ID=36898 /ORGANISM="Pyramimonas sp., Strain CCMP2087" /LENGTH=466 /DNA_ID=CAMNT_0043890515 /DNA_START=633 /DNA_END=2029 /DNA_ORIENTATION=+